MIEFNQFTSFTLTQKINWLKVKQNKMLKIKIKLQLTSQFLKQYIWEMDIQGTILLEGITKGNLQQIKEASIQKKNGLILLYQYKHQSEKKLQKNQVQPQSHSFKKNMLQTRKNSKINDKNEQMLRERREQPKDVKNNITPILQVIEQKRQAQIQDKIVQLDKVYKFKLLLLARKFKTLFQQKDILFRISNKGTNGAYYVCQILNKFPFLTSHTQFNAFFLSLRKNHPKDQLQKLGIHLQEYLNKEIKEYYQNKAQQQLINDMSKIAIQNLRYSRQFKIHKIYEVQKKPSLQQPIAQIKYRVR